MKHRLKLHLDGSVSVITPASQASLDESLATPKDAGMHPEKIKYELRSRGLTAAGIAEQVGVSPSTVSQVINYGHTSQRVMSAIAKAIGKTVEEIWPQRRTTGLRRVQPKQVAA